MNLSQLENSRGNVNVVLLMTPCAELEMFVLDRLKRMFRCNTDTSFTLNTKKDITQLKSLCNIEPIISDRWLFTADLETFPDADALADMITESKTGLFFITCETYKDYKRFKDSIKSTPYVYDFYLTRLNRQDFIYLYSAFVPSTNKLNQDLLNYVISSYSNDITQVFTLFEVLAEGTVLPSRKEITEVCGIGGNSIETLLISMLKEPPQTDKGLNIVFKRRFNAGAELGDILEWDTFGFYTKNAIKNLIDLKMLLISGCIYRDLVDIPEGYDIKKLQRYRRYIWRLKEIPMSRLLLLRQSLGTTSWTSKLDFCNFIYYYYYNIYKIKKEV